MTDSADHSPPRTHKPAERRLAWLTSPQVSAIGKDDALVVVPIGAVEQHGPHLPCITDSLLAEEITRRAIACTSIDVNVWTLPLLPFGKSNEHRGFPGTIALSTETLLAVCHDIGRGVAESGFRKLAFLNGHGGQPQLLEIVARDIRERTGLEVYPIFPYRLGRPGGLPIDPDEATWGIHAGQIETSLVLAVDAGAVDVGAIEADTGCTRALFAGCELLSLESAFPTAWLTRDLSANGAVGDATTADSTIGEAVLEHLATGVAALFTEICAFRF